jgi:hypothetical protein
MNDVFHRVFFMAKKLQTIQSLLNQPKGDIEQLMSRLSIINRLKELLPQFLDKELQKECYVVNLRNNTLIIATRSSIWSNKIRFQLTELLSQFRKLGYSSLSKIEVVVQPQSFI